MSNQGSNDISVLRNALSPRLFSDDFSDGGPAGDPEWTVAAGSWKVAGTAKSYVSSATRKNLAMVSALALLPAGRIVTSVKLISNASSGPNGAIVFDYQDPLDFRFVQLKPGKIVIWQKGTVGGTAFTNLSKKWAQSAMRWRTLQVDIRPSGLVEVRIDGSLMHSAAFVPASGGAGLWANKAHTLFDNFRIYDATVLGAP